MVQSILTREAVCREWRPFKNSARSDGLQLSHWVKASTDPEAGMWHAFHGDELPVNL